MIVAMDEGGKRKRKRYDICPKYYNVVIDVRNNDETNEVCCSCNTCTLLVLQPIKKRRRVSSTTGTSNRNCCTFGVSTRTRATTAAERVTSPVALYQGRTNKFQQQEEQIVQRRIVVHANIGYAKSTNYPWFDIEIVLSIPNYFRKRFEDYSSLYHDDDDDDDNNDSNNYYYEDDYDYYLGRLLSTLWQAAAIANPRHFFSIHDGNDYDDNEHLSMTSTTTANTNRDNKTIIEADVNESCTSHYWDDILLVCDTHGRQVVHDHRRRRRGHTANCTIPDEERKNKRNEENENTVSSASSLSSFQCPPKPFPFSIISQPNNINSSVGSETSTTTSKLNTNNNADTKNEDWEFFVAQHIFNNHHYNNSYCNNSSTTTTTTATANDTNNNENNMNIAIKKIEQMKSSIKIIKQKQQQQQQRNNGTKNSSYQPMTVKPMIKQHNNHDNNSNQSNQSNQSHCFVHLPSFSVSLEYCRLPIFALKRYILNHYLMMMMTSTTTLKEDKNDDDDDDDGKKVETNQQVCNILISSIPSVSLTRTTTTAAAAAAELRKCLSAPLVSSTGTSSSSSTTATTKYRYIPIVKLYFAGKQLQDIRTLVDYCCANGSTIHAIISFC